MAGKVVNVPALSTQLRLPSRETVAKDLLRLSRHDHLNGRLDGKRPISAGIAARLSADGKNSELVFLIPACESHPAIDLLRVTDFDNGVGYKLFEVSHHESMSSRKAQELLYKMRETFTAAVNLMERRIQARAQAAVSEFLATPLRERADDVVDFADQPAPTDKEKARDKILQIASRMGMDPKAAF